MKHLLLTCTALRDVSKSPKYASVIAELKERLLLAAAVAHHEMNLLTTFVAALCFLCGQSNAAGKLNVVFILADDLGWSDTTLFGTGRRFSCPHLLKP